MLAGHAHVWFDWHETPLHLHVPSLWSHVSSPTHTTPAHGFGTHMRCDAMQPEFPDGHAQIVLMPHTAPPHLHAPSAGSHS